jgi:heme oxygenase
MSKLEPIVADTAQRPLRQTLREATSAVHERLHHHPGFAAIQNGTIDLAGYRALLVRLYGFYLPFEAAVDAAGERSAWLRADLGDLAAVTAGAGTFETIPRCPWFPRCDTQPSRLGALYVVEGSTLGGRQLARKLDRLLGSHGVEGRRFFLGRGSSTAAGWNRFLARLTAAGSSRTARDEIVASAVTTFGIFEEWLCDWSKLTE